MDKFLAFCAPAGMLIWVIYTLINRFVVKIPDAVAYPVMIVSVAFMIVGIAYNGWCWGKGTSAFECLKK